MNYFRPSVLSSQTLDEFKDSVRFKHWNIETPPDIEEKFRDTISYQQNSFGFRDTEVSLEVDVCYYGCSYTYGAGVALSDRWTNLIDQGLNLKSNNFGINGASIEDTMQIFMATTKFIKMKKAIFLLPDYHRNTVLVEEENDFNFCFLYPNFQVAFKDRFSTPYLMSQNYFVLPESYFIDKARTHIDITLDWANVKNIEVLIATWSNEVGILLNNFYRSNDKFMTSMMITDCMGCDGRHSGPRAHKKFANDVIEIIKNAF